MVLEVFYRCFLRLIPSEEMSILHMDSKASGTWTWPLDRYLELLLRPTGTKLSLSISICSYLHSCEPPIIHGNLTCDTIFIQHNGLIKIGSGLPSQTHSGWLCVYSSRLKGEASASANTSENCFIIIFFSRNLLMKQYFLILLKSWSRRFPFNWI